jgi:hypothetical protein
MVPSDTSEESDAELEGDEPSQNAEGSRRGTLIHISPLDARFSQKKMRHRFWNGNLLADVAPLVQVIRCSAEEEAQHSARWKLQAPFPEIEVVRWRCKLRDEKTGRPKTDPQSGKVLYDQEEHLFTLDNRRLYCLQLAAATVWPEQCMVEVVELPAGPPEFKHEMKKFKTMDSGKSILIGSRQPGDTVPFVRWCWRTKLKVNEAKATKGANGKGEAKAGKARGREGKKQHHNPQALSAAPIVSGHQADGGGALLMRMLKEGPPLAADGQLDGAAAGAHLLGLLKGVASEPTKDVAGSTPPSVWAQSAKGGARWQSTTWWQDVPDKSQENIGKGRRRTRGGRGQTDSQV